jgi:type I restriction-modification system DNA methylase subunit
MDTPEHRNLIEESLKAFSSAPLVHAAMGLLDVLGYRSERRFPLEHNTAKGFIEAFVRDRPFNPAQAMVDDWQSVDFLFQLTDADIHAPGQGYLPFDSKDKFDDAIIQSYLFFAISLAKDRYTRTQLAAMTRSVNRLFDMPAMLLFRHGETITISIIRRRLHKRDESKDVLEKVTLIKDIRFSDPIRAHIEILHDLSFDALLDEYNFKNFVTLHQAWEKRLDTYQLNERFYRDVANWYFWALTNDAIVYPRSIEEISDRQELEKHRSIFLIRLLTRLIFCWFLQEKGLLPRDLFRRRYADQVLKDFEPESGTYYKAFLQNLFFATLNQEQDTREFRRQYEGTRNGNRGVTNLYRYRQLLTDPDAFVERLRKIPFVNGGLFDCLDQVYRNREGRPNVRLDDFSEEKANTLRIPNELFFSDERRMDLSDVYGDKRRRSESVRGLIEILGRYKFTVEENTPLEQEIALDPELLGRVFENLLASYNEDTKTTARKATGSFYTPREIVSYMVDEALIAYLKTALEKSGVQGKEAESKLRGLFSAASEEYPNPFSAKATAAIIEAIDLAKVLDPACGSGAFLMGALHRMVDLLQKLDPYNRHWKEQQLTKAKNDRGLAERMQDDENRTNTLREIDNRIGDIERSFDNRFHALDYARKLYLIENCIYGIDIQPIACQIAKLRFFIALIVDQNLNTKAKNLGVRPLPNLETKIVAADTLIPIEKPTHHQYILFDPNIRPLRDQLERVRHDHFNARTPEKKERCRQQDAALRSEIAELLRTSRWSSATADALAQWDPYDQNRAAGFFDPEWMFGIPVGRIPMPEDFPTTLLGRFAFMNQAQGQMELVPTREIESGFDIVIGNPPYVRIQTLKQQNPRMVAFYRTHYESATKGNYDLYVVFVERGLQLLKPTGNLAYILPHKFFNAQYGQPLRRLLAKGRHLAHVVHFGDQQVFPGSTNYVCLLFLSKAGADVCRYLRGHDLPEWLKTYRGIEAIIPSSKVTSAEWNFAVGRRSMLFDRLKAIPLKLGDVAANISQGVRTSCNDVYVLDVISEKDGLLTVWSSSLNEQVVIESDIVSLFLAGREIKAFHFQPSGKVVVIPYRHADGRTTLISAKELRNSFPKALDYLEANRKVLEDREAGRMRGQNWYGFIYPKNIGLMRQPKILVPDRASFALDDCGEFAFTSGYGITLKPTAGFSRLFLLGLLNSRFLEFFWKRVSTPLRGGFYRYFTHFIKQFPIQQLTLSAPVERAEHDAIVSLVKRVVETKKDNKAADTFGLESETDDRVYRLYGLTQEEIALVDTARLESTR